MSSFLDFPEETTSQFSHTQCKHGQCLEHVPDWRYGASEFIPSTGPFGRKNYLFIYCCGAPMAHYKEIGLKWCDKCGRKEIVTKDPNVAFCRCCHRHHSTHLESTGIK